MACLSITVGDRGIDVGGRGGSDDTCAPTLAWAVAERFRLWHTDGLGGVATSPT